MTDTSSAEPREVVVRPGARLTSGSVMLSGLAVLGVARWLAPAQAGHSTHTQLGLDPCTFLALTGWPCPMCGATTTFALMADGRIVQVGTATELATAPVNDWVRRFVTRNAHAS